MISWPDFLSYLLGAKGKNKWWPLGDEHLNHMLIAMLIAKDDDFLSESVGHGPRTLAKWDFGRAGAEQSPFDLHVTRPDGLTLIELKVWAGFSDEQKPPKAFDYMQQVNADRIVYISLTEKPRKQQSGWGKEGSSDPDKRIQTVDLKMLIKALEMTKPEAEIYQIAMDYGAALKRLSPDFWGERL